ncbi:hypothetical protein GF312_01515 [Candidatus Poribacteria bacterium]|nr:hypothetical protein [Candidatus Poribacteria bacterium]
MKRFLSFLILILILALAIGIYYQYYYRVPKKAEPKLKHLGSVSETMRLASWNIRIFSDNSRDDQELGQISDTIMDYDFVAVIELRDEKVLKRTESILNDMGKDYDYQISEPVGRGVKERYAFLYDNTKVTVLESGQIFPDTEDSFIREPYYATFRAGQFDFTAIAIHVIWGDRVSDRRAEIKKLAEVYNQIQELNGPEQDVLLMGDFNREPDDMDSYGDLFGIPSMKPIISLPEKSHITDSSLYDNIWFQWDYLKEYTGNSGIDKFDEEVFSNNDDMAIIAVSDHRPVWAEFSIIQDDD